MYADWRVALTFSLGSVWQKDVRTRGQPPIGVNLSEPQVLSREAAMSFSPRHGRGTESKDDSLAN